MDVAINPSGAFGVLARVNGSRRLPATIEACDKLYEVQLNRSGQQVHLTCDYQLSIGIPSPMQVSRMRVHAVRTPPSTPEPFKFIQVVRPPDLGWPGWRISLREGQGAFLGSPITADPENDGPIPIEFIDDLDNVIGSMELPPNQTVDIEPGATSGLTITNLGTAPLTITLGGVTQTLNPAETHTDPCAGVPPNQPPTISGLADLTVNTDPGSSSATVPNLAAPAGTDRCGRSLTAVGARGDGRRLTEPFPLGVTNVTWTATDQLGNQAAAVQMLTVVDTEPPGSVARCPSQLSS